MHTANVSLSSSPCLLPIIAVIVAALLGLSALLYVGSEARMLSNERKSPSSMDSNDPMHMVATNLW